MNRWLIVAGDFTPLGGMDAANHALARYLADRADVHLVAHRAWPDLQRARVSLDCVPRPFGHAVGAPMLDHRGRRAWKRIGASGARAIVNGGNCLIAGAVNWVHYLHAAYCPEVAGSPFRRAKRTVEHRRNLGAERTAIARASLVICNSRRTAADVAAAYDGEPARIRIVYYGCDADRLSPVVPARRAAAREALGWPNRPTVAFVGALGDRRKGFDVVFDSWMALCRDAGWNADLVVVGTGAEQPAWAARARAAGAGDRVRFLGFRADVPELLAAVDLVVHPARYEAYGLAVREALSRGIPAVVSARAGVAEECEGPLRELLVDDPNAVENVTDRLLRWHRDKSRFDRAADDVGRRLRARTWDQMAAEIVSAAAESSAVA